ncbi:MAG: hypothetical protein ACLR0U_30955 [Enterocloster clostridioformis]
MDGACEPGVQGNAIPGGKSLLLARERFLRTGEGEFTRFSLSDLVMEKILIFEPVFYQRRRRWNIR